MMLDSNVFDRLDADREALSELANRRDLRPMVSAVQLAELAAIPDHDKRDRLLGIAGELCASLAAPGSLGAADAGRVVAPGREAPRKPAFPDPASHDGLILAAAKARCRLLVSDDKTLLEAAAASGLKAMDFDSFAARVLFRRA